MDQSTIVANQLERALLELNQERAEAIILEASNTSSPLQTASNLITSVLQNIGDSWENGKLALSQVYTSSIICEKIIDQILPPQSPVRKNQPVTAIGVVEDYHLLGKRIIYATLRASGIELIDLGGGLSIDQIIREVQDHKIKILLLSVLMLPSALRIKELMNKLKDKDVKVVVGGAPFRFDETLFREVGADFHGKDSAEALSIVNQLMNQES
jgi:methanogenic corrinoid protein MtbC1